MASKLAPGSTISKSEFSAEPQSGLSHTLGPLPWQGDLQYRARCLLATLHPDLHASRAMNQGIQFHLRIFRGDGMAIGG